MFCGSLGFPALKELLDYSRYNFKGRKGKLFAFSLQTKIILYGSFAMAVFGMILLFFSERNNTLVGMDPLHKVVTLLFNSVSFRSAGFVLVPVETLTIGTIIVMMLFGFIGSSPGSTGSGVKITSFAVCIAAVKAIMSGNTRVHIGGRTIAMDQIIKAFTIIAVSGAWILMVTFIMSITEQGCAPLDLFLEVSSAFTNLGVSAGLTEHLSVIGKWLIIASMLVGRIGSLAFILAWVKRSLVKSARTYSYPEERIMLE